MAKKKKAANPARGFATTSTPSKPKPEKAPEPALKAPEKEAVAVSSGPLPSVPVDVKPSAAAVHQSPEDLEAQLEQDELQLLVEKHAARIRRESRRQVTKFQTDQRVLRPQAQSMTVHDWLSDEILDKIIDLAHAESNDSNRRQGQQSLLKVLSEEDAMTKLWSLDLTLREMGFSAEHIQPVLQWLCANAANIDATAGNWGFQEALEWLALNQSEGDSFSYEEAKAKPRPAANLQPSSPTSPDSRPATPVSTASGDKKAAGMPSAPSPSMAPPPGGEATDVVISDLDSDIEPDQIVPTYLKIKGRLFEIDPDAVDAKSGKSRKKGKTRNPTAAVESPAVRKLRSQLQQLESDAFFDEAEAEALWPAKRNEVAQSKAAEKRSQVDGPVAPREESQSSPPVKKGDASSGSQNGASVMDDEDDVMLGGMFTAVPDEPDAAATSGDISSENIALRDFGKQSGITPRRVLEEAIRAR
jgi:ATP-dependent RNA helicase DHX29